MKKKDIIIIAAVLAAALALFGVSQIAGGREASTVVVTVEGREVLRRPLAMSDTYEIKQDDGAVNVIAVENGAVYMKEANCRDGLCIHQGKMKNAAKTIVCLPHKLVVRLEGDSAPDGQDATHAGLMQWFAATWHKGKKAIPAHFGRDTLRGTTMVVHGDTVSTVMGAYLAKHFGMRVAHVEAGLRTNNKWAPFPEEMNRRLTGAMTDVHFAPTATAKANLLREGVSADAIHVTGNTVIDALLAVVDKLRADAELRQRLDKEFSFLDPNRRLILVTGHRRENFGEGFQNICHALADIASAHPDVQVLYPVHLNPNVRQPVHDILAARQLGNVHLIDPVDYLPFVYLMDRAHLIITDSGGVQEEAPSLGKPVLVMRDTTERPEAVEAGTVRLVGTNRQRLVAEAEHLLADSAAYAAMAQAHNPYGDGQASQRIVKTLLNLMNKE